MVVDVCKILFHYEKICNNYNNLRSVTAFMWTQCILPALKNSEIVTNCALTKAVTMLKNKCMLIRLHFI